MEEVRDCETYIFSRTISAKKNEIHSNKKYLFQNTWRKRYWVDSTSAFRMQPSLSGHWFSNTLFFVAENEGKIIGCCGFEVCGENALFRSLAVNPNYRNLRIARLLTDKITNFASEMGIRAFYLLTTTAGAYFIKQGWNETDRMDVPMGISRTTEFLTICPATATCMMCHLEPVSK